MDAQLSGGQLEDEPASVSVDVGQAQHVTEEGPSRLGVLGKDDGVDGVDHPASMDGRGESVLARGGQTQEVADLLTRRDVVDRLRAAGCLAADDEADEMLSAATDPATLQSWVWRREHGEPLAWITGTQVFCGHHVRVDAGVYVPRPQSEELARRAADVLAARGGPALDLCTGTGAIARHLMDTVPTAGMVATDIDARAVRCARTNGVAVVQADLAAPFAAGTFEIVTAVAPYVPTESLAVLPADVRRYEPRRALDGGGDGLDLVRRIVAEAARILRPGGSLFLELGGDQDTGLGPSLAISGWTETTTWMDEDGDLRGLSSRAPSP